MKAIYSTIAIFLFLISLTFAQKEKTERFNFRYERFPSNSFNSSVKTYCPKMIELPMAGFHSDSIDVSTLVKFQKSYMHKSVQMPTIIQFPDLKRVEESEADVITILVYGNPIISAKEVRVNPNFTPAPGGSPDDGGYNYCYKISIPCKLIVKDRNGNILRTDSITASQTEECLFPKQGYFDCSHSGLVSTHALEVNWEKYGQDYIKVSEIDVLSKEVDKLNVNMRLAFSYDPKEPWTIKYFYLKDKKNTYKDLDTALQLFTAIFDTVSANQKALNHLNWHCESVKKNAKKCYEIINKATAEAVKDMNENKKGRFDWEFIDEMIIDLCTAEWLKGDFKSALTGLEFMRKKLTVKNPFHDLYLTDLIDFIKKDMAVFETNKTKLNWN